MLDSLLSSLARAVKSAQGDVTGKVGLGMAVPLYLRKRIDALGGVDGVPTPQLVDAFMRVLDARSSGTGTVAFETRFRALLDDPKTTEYLGFLGSALHDGQNLWTATLKFTGQDRARALELVGVLFQDTSPLASDLHFLVTKGGLSDRQKVNVVQVLAVGKQLHALSAAQVFPPGSKVSVDSESAYHFWTMAYATSRMEAAVPGADGRVVPFLFNLFYEYTSNRGLLSPSHERVKDLRPWNALSWVSDFLHPKDPASIDAVRHGHAIEDIYLGYAGANFGASREADAFEATAPKLSANPRAWIESEFFPGTGVTMSSALGDGALAPDADAARINASLRGKSGVTLADVPRQTPFDSESIYRGLRESAPMLGSPIPGGARLVEVAEPGTVGDVAKVMGGLADHARHGLQQEYGLLLYQDGAGKRRCFVQRGESGLGFGELKPHALLDLPGGERLHLLGVLAHTHPARLFVPGASKPDRELLAATQDFEAASKAPFRQRYALVLQPGGGQVLYDPLRDHPLDDAVAQRPWESLFSST